MLYLPSGWRPLQKWSEVDTVQHRFLEQHNCSIGQQTGSGGQVGLPDLLQCANVIPSNYLSQAGQHLQMIIFFMTTCTIIQYIDICILYAHVHFIAFRIIRKTSMSLQKSNFTKPIVKDEENDACISQRMWQKIYS